MLTGLRSLSQLVRTPLRSVRPLISYLEQMPSVRSQLRSLSSAAARTPQRYALLRRELIGVEGQSDPKSTF